MKARPIALALLLAFVPATVAIPHVAYAQDDALTKAARARFQEGVDFFDKGNFEAARAAFTQAYALKQHPAVLLNLAQSCLKSGHFLEADKDFQKYLADPQGDKKDDARKGLLDARSKLGRLDVLAPAGSELTVDSDAVGKAPLNEAVDVDAGNHTVRAKLPDGTTNEQKVVVTAGQLLPVRFNAVATVVTPPLNPNPPLNSENPNPPINPNPPTNPNPPVNPPPNNPPPQSGPVVHPTGALVLMIAGGALAVGGFIVGGAMGAEKSTANSNYVTVQNTITSDAMKDGLNPNGLCNNPPSKYANACATLQSDANAVNQDATVANTMIVIGIVGVAAVVGGVLWYFLGAKPKNDSTASRAMFTPWAGPGVAGGAFGFKF
jgi:PEGA domain